MQLKRNSMIKKNTATLQLGRIPRLRKNYVTMKNKRKNATMKKIASKK
jgi:hypothetical protein